MEDTKQNGVSSSEDMKANAEGKSEKKSNGKYIALIVGILAALILLVVSIGTDKVTYHTFGDVSFSAPGEWKVEDEKSESVLDFLTMNNTVVTNGVYDGEVATIHSPEKISQEMSDEIIKEAIQNAKDSTDFVQGTSGNIAYAGGLFENSETLGRDVVGGYIIVDRDTDIITTFAVYGDKSLKEDVTSSYKSAKYKDINLYH